MTKEVMWSNLEIPSLRAGIDLENRTQILAAGTEDSKTAMSSFLGHQDVAWKTVSQESISGSSEEHPPAPLPSRMQILSLQIGQ